MDHRRKYIKYKIKYITLKNHIGGALEYYMPCEITHITKAFYTGTKLLKDSSNIIKTLKTFADIILYRSPDIMFHQDQLHIFKRHDNTNFAIVLKQINMEAIKLPLYKENYVAENIYTLGGNFISSPNIDHVSCIFYIKDNKQNDDLDKLITTMESMTLQPLVGLSCAFAPNGRHVDEILTFMPYGLNQFKIWIYGIGNVILTEDVAEFIEMTDWTNMYAQLNEMKKQWIIKQEQFKTPQAKESMANAILSLNIILDMSTDITTKKQAYNNIRKYGNKVELRDIKILHYWIHFYLQHGIVSREQFTEYYRVILTNELNDNLNRISMNIFKEPYDMMKDHFYISAIDFSINFILRNMDYTIQIVNKCMIFNRIWIETPDVPTMLLPDCISESVHLELQSIKSMVNNKSPNIITLNIDDYIAVGSVDEGGGLHCLIKQSY